MIKYSDNSAGSIFNPQSTRLYKVKFAEKELLVRAADLSQAEYEYGGIESIERVDAELFTPAQHTIIYTTSGGTELAQNPITEEWRKGPNWT
jgi:hypothetical protein